MEQDKQKQNAYSTVLVSKKNQKRLKDLRIANRESYDEILNRLLKSVENGYIIRKGEEMSDVSLILPQSNEPKQPPRLMPNDDIIAYNNKKSDFDTAEFVK